MSRGPADSYRPRATRSEQLSQREPPRLSRRACHWSASFARESLNSQEDSSWLDGTPLPVLLLRLNSLLWSLKNFLFSVIGSGRRQVLDLKGLRPPGADEKEVTCEVCSGNWTTKLFFFFCTGRNLEITGPGPSHPLFSRSSERLRQLLDFTPCSSCSQAIFQS